MSNCAFCGAPITLSNDAPTNCKYCGQKNDPAPREVQVPVPVQVVQNVVQVVGAPGTAPAELRCPHCKKRLVEVVAKDVKLDGCAGCGGIWIDNESATRVLAKPEPVFAELAKRAGNNARHRVQTENPGCPVCTAVLDRVTTHGIALDVCNEHGTWFDAFELGQLVGVLRGELKPAESPDGQSFVCAYCQQRISAARANVTEAGLTCESCWATVRSTERVAEEAQNERTGQIVTGVLLGLAAGMLGGVAGSSRS